MSVLWYKIRIPKKKIGTKSKNKTKHTKNRKRDDDFYKTSDQCDELMEKNDELQKQIINLRKQITIYENQKNEHTNETGLFNDLTLKKKHDSKDLTLGKSIEDYSGNETTTDIMIGDESRKSTQINMQNINDELLKAQEDIATLIAENNQLRLQLKLNSHFS